MATHMRDMAHSDAEEQERPHKEEDKAAEKIEKKIGTGPHSAHCDSCGFGFSKVTEAEHPHRKAVHHSMKHGHVVHVIHHHTGRAVSIHPHGHLHSIHGPY